RDFSMLVTLLSYVVAAGRVRAEATEPPILVPPEAQKPVLAGEVHVDMLFPLLRKAFCPEGAACVLEEGLGLGFSVERRWPTGLGLILGYDAWFLNSNNVFELA